MELKKINGKNLSEKDIFLKFRQYCVSWDVIPIYADKNDDYRYHLLTLDKWMVMLDQRIARIGKEFKNKIDILRQARDTFPQATKREFLVASHKPKELKEYVSEE